jgi:hypothetical protein
VATTATTANIAVVDSDEVGRSAVFSIYTNDPRTLGLVLSLERMLQTYKPVNV